jgi:peptide/nickel transport system permease protein
MQMESLAEDRTGRPRRPVLGRRQRSLLRLIGIRIVLAVPVILGVTTLIFVVGTFAKQDPARSVLGVDASAEVRADFDRAHGLNDPLVVRYVRYLNQLAHGDLGVTLATQEPIGDLMRDAAPVTVSLTLMASGLALLIGAALGTAAAMRRNSPLDRVVLFFSSLGHSLPSFWVGLVFIEIFAVHWALVPSGGYTAPSTSVTGWLRGLIGPALVLAIPFGAVMARVIRGAMVEELSKDYVRTAQGLGLSTGRIVFRNVLRNALVAPLTAFGIGVGSLLSGAVLIESLFQLPGLGLMMVNGVQQGDYGLVRAVAIFGVIAYLLVNLIVDILVIVLTPREWAVA